MAPGDERALPALDGVIFTSMPWDIIQRWSSRSRHCIVCSGAWDPGEWPVVSLDDGVVGRQAAQHLMDLRLERFGYFWGAEYYVARKRLAGFRDALSERGFSCVTCPLPTPTAEQLLSHSHRPGVIEWLRGLPKPIGFFAFDDGWANELAEICHEADLAVPDQVAIVGVNNDDLVCETAQPPLSSVEPDYARVGFAAAELLDRMIVGAELSAPERCIVVAPLGVVQRQSTTTLAIDDPDLSHAIRYIREHACDPCTVEDVLRAVPVGRRWLERQFASRLGRTPHDEITRVRVETAQRMLLHTALGVTEIASKCGFSHQRNLNTAFRKLTGTTPGAFRRAAAVGSDPKRR